MGSVGQAYEADGGVAQGGHDVGSVAGAQLVAVLIEGDVPHPVQAVLDAPVALDPGGDLVGLGGQHGQGADQVHHLTGLPASPLTVGPGARTPHLQDLGDVGEVDPGRDLGGADRAAGPAPVGGVNDLGGRQVLPVHPLQLLTQAWLVALDGQHEVTAPGADPLDRLPLRVQGVRGDHSLGQVGVGQQVPQGRDLVGPGPHSLLSDHGAAVLVQGGQQMRSPTGPCADLALGARTGGLALLTLALALALALALGLTENKNILHYENGMNNLLKKN